MWGVVRPGAQLGSVQDEFEVSSGDPGAMLRERRGEAVGLGSQRTRVDWLRRQAWADGGPGPSPARSAVSVSLGSPSLSRVPCPSVTVLASVSFVSGLQLCPASVSFPSPTPSSPPPLLSPSPSARSLCAGGGGVAGSRRRPRAGVSPDGPVGGVGVPRRHHADQGAHLRVLLHLQEAGGRPELGGLVHICHGHAHDRLVAERAQVSEARVHELVQGLQDHGVHRLGLEVQALGEGAEGR